MTMVGENGPLMDGWRLPPRHCGTYATAEACTICGDYVPRIPTNVVLSDN